jgi:predicted nucleic acid-binding protein
MMLIDTSAWVEFLRRSGDPGVKARVASFLDAGVASVCGPVEFELLAGARPSEMVDVQTAISLCEQVDFSSSCWRRAAAVERDLRGLGVTVPRDDVFVASVALEYDMPLYACDAHFELIQGKGRQQLRLA